MKKFLCSATVASSFLLVSPIAAETITWTGTNSDPALSTAPYAPLSGSNAFLPSTATSDNTVNIVGGSIPVSGSNGGNVLGGSTDATEGKANNNQVNLSGENTAVNIGVYGGASKLGEANHNTVTIANGSVGWVVVGGASDSGQACDNIVNLQGGTIGTFKDSSSIPGQIYGGWSQGSADVTNNQVHISGGSAKEVFGGSSSSGTVSGNRVAISAGTVSSRVYGGHSLSSAATSNNTVEISGGTIHSSIYGGYSSSGNVTGNTIIISGNPSLGATTTLYGGYSSSGTVSGNRLHIKTTGLTIGSLSGFDHLDFSLSAEVTLNIPLLKLSSGSFDLTDVAVNILAVDPSVSLQVGDSITLLQTSSAEKLTGTPGTLITSITNGSVVEYLFDLTNSDGKLLATLASQEGAGLSEQNKSFSESFLSGLAILGQASDAVANLGINSALQSSANANGLAGFGGISGGTLRHNTGSHIRMDSYSLLAGLARQWHFAAGQLVAGAFLEYGDGSYDTYNSFASAPEIRGKGDSYYLGGGMLARMHFTNTAEGQPYLEGSLRAGSVDNDYTGHGYSGGSSVSYDYHTAYFGMHMGAGYRWNIREELTLDCFGKTFWTRQHGKSVISSAGDNIRFDDADSLQTRLGVRVEYQLDSMLQLYAGLAWEREFCGDATGTVENFSLAIPSLKGNSGIGELGLALRPLPDKPHFMLSLGAQGFVGKRQGVTGHGQIKYEF